jgi:hypothetical protein
VNCFDFRSSGGGFEAQKLQMDELESSRSNVGVFLALVLLPD